MKATTYQLRTLTGEKTQAGSIGLSTRGGLDLDEAANELTARLDVIVLPSGHVSFASNGKPVNLYLAIDPAETEKGRAALAAHRQAQEAANRAAAEKEASIADELQEAIDGIGAQQALDLLRQARDTQR